MAPAYYITSYVNEFVSVCAVIIGLAFWRRSHLSIRFVTVFLIYTQLINVAQNVSANLLGNNMPTVHAYIAGSYTLIALLFAFWYKSPLTTYLRWSILAYLGIHSALLFSGIEQLDQPNKYSSQVAAFAIAGITLYTIFKLAQQQADQLIHKSPIFWISLGIFMLFPGTIFVTAAITIFYSFNLLVIYNIMAIFGYCLISVGFLCLKLKS